MKTVINKGSERFEFFKRILYSFQVIIVSIALPFLFLIGTSARYQKKPSETEMRGNDQVHEVNSSIPWRQEMSELVKILPHIVISQQH